MNIIAGDGLRTHVNYFQRLVDNYFRGTFGVSEINTKLAKKQPVRGFAKSGEATFMVYDDDGNLKQIGLHHNHHNSLLINTSGSKDFAPKAFIVSEKHSDCPLILVRNRTGKEVGVVMWHLSYHHLVPLPGVNE